MIEKNGAYISRNGYGGDALDEIVVKAMIERSYVMPSGFFEHVIKMMVCSAII
jgi:hypothetical protein